MGAVRALICGMGALGLTRVGAVESCGSAEKTSILQLRSIFSCFLYYTVEGLATLALKYFYSRF